MKTKELIQELVGLCVDKGIHFTMGLQLIVVASDNYQLVVKVDILQTNANQQLQAAIERVKAL